MLLLYILIINTSLTFKVDEIATDPRTQPYVTAFGQNAQHFFYRFSSGFLKLSNYKVLVGGKGEIRRDCRFINS